MAGKVTKADSLKEDDDRITFKKLRDKKERGIVCEKAVDVGREWNCREAENVLINKVDEIIQEIGKIRLSEYYIGKTFVNAIGQKLDETDQKTWDLEGIKSRWGDPKYEGYDGLIFLTVIKAVKGRNFTHEDFALALEQRLVHYYTIDRNTSKIKNPTFQEGQRRETRGQEEVKKQGYAVYMAVKIR